MNEDIRDYVNKAVIYYILRDIFALYIYFLITSHIAGVIYQIDININFLRQIMMCLILTIFFFAIGIWIEAVRFERTILILIIGIISIIFLIFLLSLINDLIAWKKIFTTLLTIIREAGFNSSWENKLLSILKTDNKNRFLNIFLWITIILPILGLIIKRIIKKGMI